MAKKRKSSRRGWARRMIENPDPKTSALILRLDDEGKSRAEIARATGLKPDTVRKFLAKKGRGKKQGKETPRAVQEKILAMRAEGLSMRDIARAVDIPHPTVVRIIKRAGGLKVPIQERILSRLTPEQREMTEAPATEAFGLRRAVQEASKDASELTWAIAASKMLLIPAMDAPIDRRLKRIEQELRHGTKELSKSGRTPVVDGRNLVEELREVAKFAFQMATGAEPSEYLKRYRKGGVAAMMKYGEKVVEEQEIPVEAEQISDFVTLATMQQALPTGTRRAFDPARLAGELSAAAEQAELSRGSRRAGAEFTQELRMIGRLRGLAHRDPQAFWEALRAEREATKHLHGKVRRWSEQRLRNVMWEVLETEEERRAAKEAMEAGVRQAPRAIVEAAEARKEAGKTAEMAEYLRDRELVRSLAERLGHKVTDKLIDDTLLEMGWAGRGIRRNPSTWGDRLFARVNTTLRTGGDFRPRKAKRERGRQAVRRRLGRLMRL